MTNKSIDKARRDPGTSSIKIMVQRVEYDTDGNPVLVHDCVKIEAPPTQQTKKGGAHD